MPKIVNSGPLKETKSKENEIFPLVNELRELATQYGALGPFTGLGTLVAPIVTIWTSEEIPEGGCWSVTLRAQAMGTTAQARFVRDALFSRQVGGAAAQTGATASPVTIRTDANLTASLSLLGNTVQAILLDGLGRDLSWYAWVEVRVSR